MAKKAFSTFEQKVEWLLKHHIFLVGKSSDKHKIVLGMKLDDLVSPLTYWPDVRLDDAIKQAKEVHVKASPSWRESRLQNGEGVSARREK